MSYLHLLIKKYDLHARKSPVYIVLQHLYYLYKRLK